MITNRNPKSTNKRK